MNNTLNLLFYFIKKDIKARYAGSGLGLLWTVLMPVIQILLFWFVFSGIMKARPYAATQMPYIYFLLSTLFCWLSFSEGLTRASTAIIDNADMVKKISFPKIVLPITVTVTSYIHNLTGFIIFILVYLITTSFDTVFILTIPVIILQLIFSFGLAMIVSALVPYIRDIGQILSQVVQGLFFLSPILYSIESVPDKFKIIFYFNPFTHFATIYHKLILLKEMPCIASFTIILFMCIASLLTGLYSFNKLKDGFADVL